MSSSQHTHVSIADLAWRASEGFELIARAATTEQPPASMFENPLQLEDMIGYAMLHVLPWIERNRDGYTAARLRKRMIRVLRGMHKAPKKDESGALVLDVFSKARQMVYELQQFAADIRKEESAEQQSDEQRNPPDDETLYVPASDLLKPDDWPKNFKQLNAELEKHSIRRRRPTSKTGKPKKNRLLVHIVDWLAHLRKRKSAASPKAYDDLLDRADLTDDVKNAIIKSRKEDIDREHGRLAN